MSSDLEFWAIKNKETGEFFRGLTGKVLFTTKGNATNSFNEKHRPHKWSSGSGMFQKQDKWVHVKMRASEVLD